ncbi:MAG: peptide-methionine (R)-S-oxide reductase MsrB [Bacteroidota bacterium]
MKKYIYLCIVFLIASCQSKGQSKEEDNFEVNKTESEWKEQLDDKAFRVLRKAETEPKNSSLLNNIETPGTFVCAGCQNPLYKTKHKFDSGTGWPSFDRAIEGSLTTKKDNKLGYTRKEAVCNKCGGHLGHIFTDGPKETTGMRHCINGAALEFIPEKD